MIYNFTNFLKGIAISSVLINHYILKYTTINQIGYANGIIGIFFILSGFGLYLSLEKRNKQDKLISNIIGRFYLDRFTRIFPLFYIALILGMFFFNISFKITPLSLLGLEWSGKYWFIVAIIHCYLLSIPLTVLSHHLAIFHFLHYLVSQLPLLNLYLQLYFVKLPNY